WLAAGPGAAAEAGFVGAAIGAGAPAADAEEPSGLEARLAGLEDAEQDAYVRSLVLAETSAVLGGQEPLDSEGTHTFKEMGINSVNAVELRNRLIAATDLRLPATLVYDHPTPNAVVRLVRERLARPATAARDVDSVVAELESLLTAGAEVSAEAVARLKAMAAGRDGTTDTGSGGPLDLTSASDEDLFRLMDAEH
ncbi:hypothetical protein DF18_37855, partial [Streptomyces rimosus]